MIKAKKEKADRLQDEYLNLRANNRLEESLVIEKEYAKLRIEIIDEVTEEVAHRKSISMTKLEAEVDAMPEKVRKRTGITSLDVQLNSGDARKFQELGGFTLGNFIQIAGAKYTGKTTLTMKMMTHFSKTESVAWFDFEMGREKAVDTSRLFKRMTDNINYYDGNREISHIIDEIKFLYADGVRHFVIDSMMKISAKGHKRGYETASYVSSVLSELTSSMGINIYMINQLSQDSLRNGDLFLKHGNDIEYDSDYMFFLLRKKTGNKDSFGMPIYDDTQRILICTKNRVDHETFSIEIPKHNILQEKR